ncbi:MAG: hypothetical protein L6R43_16055 [Planctomycetes bacterium]|nr:hypothetical protein [Planctomycetota bacterium]
MIRELVLDVVAEALEPLARAVFEPVVGWIHRRFPHLAPTAGPPVPGACRVAALGSLLVLLLSAGFWLGFHLAGLGEPWSTFCGAGCAAGVLGLVGTGLRWGVRGLYLGLTHAPPPPGGGAAHPTASSASPNARGDPRPRGPSAGSP